jgi:hypothetical protein
VQDDGAIGEAYLSATGTSSSAAGVDFFNVPY